MRQRTSRGLLAPGLLALALSVGACAEGTLEQAEISPDCAPGDVACQTLGLSAPLAVGARQELNLSVASPGNGTPLLTLEVALEEVARVDGLAIVGEAPGLTALLLNTEGGTVIDFVHVWVAEANRIALHRLDGAVPSASELGPQMQLLVDDDVILAANPYAGDERLLGSAEATWTVSGTAVSLLDEGLPARRRVVAREVGSATVSVEMLGTTTQIDLEVLP